MDCPICKRLERTLESRRSVYIEASSSAYYRVSTRLAAYANVEMERAKSDLQDHLLVCFSTAKLDTLDQATRAPTTRRQGNEKNQGSL